MTSFKIRTHPGRTRTHPDAPVGRTFGLLGASAHHTLRVCERATQPPFLTKNNPSGGRVLTAAGGAGETIWVSLA
jgi:hypothetical protein